ncbi:hypothetical protein ACWDOR_16940 [Streptosporangium canum]|uniref:hypothetical protein n=1 Tax=Streptosporangium canum TaxID=324952 RepID=UPI00368C33F5
MTTGEHAGRFTGVDEQAGERRVQRPSAPAGVVLYAVSFLTLPAAEAMTHGWAVELGWIDE